eukprot:126952-Pleurochrysis_carterae.AAC.2
MDGLCRISGAILSPLPSEEWDYTSHSQNDGNFANHYTHACVIVAIRTQIRKSRMQSFQSHDKGYGDKSRLNQYHNIGENACKSVTSIIPERSRLVFHIKSVRCAPSTVCNRQVCLLCWLSKKQFAAMATVTDAY